MATVLSKPITLQDFLQMPETKPASEYIDGQIIQKPMPKGKHSLLQTRLPTVLNGALHPEEIAWAFSELRCTFGRRSTIPDVCVFTPGLEFLVMIRGRSLTIKEARLICWAIRHDSNDCCSKNQVG